jgi:hypothetical protein
VDWTIQVPSKLYKTRKTHNKLSTRRVFVNQLTKSCHNKVYQITQS